MNKRLRLTPIRNISCVNFCSFFSSEFCAKEKKAKHPDASRSWVACFDTKERWWGLLQICTSPQILGEAAVFRSRNDECAIRRYVSSSQKSVPSAGLAAKDSERTHSNAKKCGGGPTDKYTNFWALEKCAKRSSKLSGKYVCWRNPLKR